MHAPVLHTFACVSAGSAASLAFIHASMKEAVLCAASTKDGGSLQRPPPVVDCFMDGCGKAGEARGILNRSDFVATLLELHSNFVATSSELAKRVQGPEELRHSHARSKFLPEVVI